MLKINLEISLILDVKTRWNSLLTMLDCFHLLQNCVRKSLIDIKSSISFADSEINLLSEIISALQLLKSPLEHYAVKI